LNLGRENQAQRGIKEAYVEDALKELLFEALEIFKKILFFRNFSNIHDCEYFKSFHNDLFHCRRFSRRLKN
jgi:hypothetical protein